MHRITQESKIRRDLFIKPGDRFDPLLVTNNRQLIRSRSYIADANIRVIPATSDSSVVDLIVTTRDRWTIGIDLNSQSDGNTYFELYDDNILGWGNKAERQDLFQLEKLELRRQPVRIREPEYPGRKLRRRAHHRRQRIQLLRLRNLNSKRVHPTVGLHARRIRLLPPGTDRHRPVGFDDQHLPGQMGRMGR